MQPQAVYRSVEQNWQDEVMPTLQDYIRIPNKSPAFDPDWEKNGYMEQAVQLLATWCQKQQVQGLQLEIIRKPGKTPLLWLEIPGHNMRAGEEAVVLYGHLDKQPEMTGWRSDLNPWQPVLRGDLLYGRGAGDDGYAIFTALTAIKVLQQHKIPHPRCIILIEASEESGSSDLIAYLEDLTPRLQQPKLIICLDSGCGNYDQLWCTTSLRGLVSGDLNIGVLKEGVHSGAAGGVVPCTFRILRQLLSRVENEQDGKILLDAFHAPIPENRIQEAQQAANTLGASAWREFPWLEGVQLDHIDMKEVLLNRSWRPALSIIGIDGIPSRKDAGNVLRPEISARLSIRVPPTCNAEQAQQALATALTQNPPYHAAISFTEKQATNGWNAPALTPWLTESIEQASLHYFDKPACYWGEGGSIPFMGMLGEKFPQAQFMITGVLGPQSNAHGPNEFLHLPTAKKVTACIAEVLAKYYQYHFKK